METPGALLKREREARGISLKEIGSVTRIPVCALRNIESDRFDLFPAEVFAKGFVRNYARELQLSVEDIMLAYNALRQQQRRQEVTELKNVESVVSVRSENISPLVLGTPEPERTNNNNSPIESAQRTFRFAYLVVFLVVATSLALSLLFTGTGEAEENEKRKSRPVVETEAEKASPWLISDTHNTTTSGDSQTWNRSKFPDNDIDR